MICRRLLLFVTILMPPPAADASYAFPDMFSRGYAHDTRQLMPAPLTLSRCFRCLRCRRRMLRAAFDDAAAEFYAARCERADDAMLRRCFRFIADISSLFIITPHF